MLEFFEEYFTEKKNLDKLLHIWRTRSPIYWSKINSFCWLYDWSLRNKIEFHKLKNLSDKLPRGKKLCELNFEFFINLSSQHGLDIFEDLHIILSSFHQTKRPKKYKIEKIKKFRKIKTERRIKKNVYVWEFLREILFDKNKNPEIIKWLNRSKGIFVLVKPIEIAEMWGKFVFNEKMNYEKFTRSIRYCYRKKFIQHLDEKFTYKFGPKSYGW